MSDKPETIVLYAPASSARPGRATRVRLSEKAQWLGRGYTEKAQKSDSAFELQRPEPESVKPKPTQSPIKKQHES